MFRGVFRKTTGHYFRVVLACVAFCVVVIWFTAPRALFTSRRRSDWSGKPAHKWNYGIGVPGHLSMLFDVKQLHLVALDPLLLNCLSKDDCVGLMASPSIHIGTFLPDTRRVRKVFNTNLKGKIWTLKVVDDNTVVFTADHWTGFQKNVVVSILQNKPGNDYYVIPGNELLGTVTKAVSEFDTTELDGFTVPADIERFQVWWENGRFLECNRTLANLMPKDERNIKDEHVAAFKTFTNMLLDSGQLPMLTFGTLLGWFRNCGVIPHTTDLDVVVKVAQYKEDFLTKLKGQWGSDFGVIRVLAKLEYGLEVTIRIPGSDSSKRLDVFYLYPHNSSFEWTSTTYGKGSTGWPRLKTYLPTVHEVCTGDIDGYLFFLPCNFMDHISAVYAETWSQSIANQSYTGDNILTFYDGAWNKKLDDIIEYF